MSEEEPKKELSKNEQKKLAKKAEKARKKALAAKGEGGGAAAAAAPPATPAAGVVETAAAAAVAAAAAKPSTTAKDTAATPNDTKTTPCCWSIAGPKANDRSTIVAVWANQAIGNSPLKVASSSNKKKTYTQPTLICGEDLEISGGGNAMALAIYNSHSSRQDDVSVSFLDSCFIDEWCEWERAALRPQTTTTKDLEYLESALVSQSCSHLVGNSLTVADISVATTLFLKDSRLLDDKSSSEVLSAFPHVAIFCKAHTEAYQKAVQMAQELQDEQEQQKQVATVSMDELLHEPCILKVCDAVIRNTVAQIFGNDIVLPKMIVKYSQHPKQGDIQCSVAMPIFSILKKNQNTEYNNPKDVATAIMKEIGVHYESILTDTQLQGQGFILARLHPNYLQHHANLFLQTNKLPFPKQQEGKKITCVVDFSSPNIAKEMHVGHLRSTIIGEAVCRILEGNGFHVHRVNHVGDWGTQFGMLIQYLKEEYPDVCNSDKEGGSLPNITDLTEFYKNAKQRFDESPEFKKLSQTNVVDLQSGDPECRRIWKMLCDVSRGEFQKVYNRLDVSCEEFGESFYNDKIPPVIDEFTAKGNIKIEEGGAKCVFVDKFQIPLMLQKSDGGYGYDSTDMAALKYRLQELHADRIIVITDFTQGDHFKMVYSAGHDIGWIDKGQKLEHIGFGTVQGEDGKRFKTRSGDTVRLVDLLDEAVSRMEAELKKRIDDGKANITIDEVHGVAEAIGYGAVKYFDLRRNPTSNYKFSYDQMLDTKGDTAVYLLYARVRLESIASKAAAEHGVSVEELLKQGVTIDITHPSERNLALQLQQFADVMEMTLDDLYPCHICEYVYKLATAASDFVTQCRVLGSPEMQSRVLLCYATASAMHQCFDLLGIRHVKRI